MSTHNIGFYEDWTKIIFQLSSNTHLISSSDTDLFRFCEDFIGYLFEEFYWFVDVQDWFPCGHVSEVFHGV